MVLLERGWWCDDNDIICLKPFDFSEEYVFSSEISRGLEVINCGAIKAPVGSQVMAFTWVVCQVQKPEELFWGETGPRVRAEAVWNVTLGEDSRWYRQCHTVGNYERRVS